MAHLRQLSTTSQRRQLAFAPSIWKSAGPVFPIGKNSWGSSPRHVARSRQVILDQASWIVVGGNLGHVSQLRRLDLQRQGSQPKRWLLSFFIFSSFMWPPANSTHPQTSSIK